MRLFEELLPAASAESKSAKPNYGDLCKTHGPIGTNVLNSRSFRTFSTDCRDKLPKGGRHQS